MKRILEFLLALALIFFLLIPILLIIIILLPIFKGNVFYISIRIGKNNKKFKMLKFRTMKIDTPELATHLMKNNKRYITKFGSFLRKYSLDEIPQLINILTGDMTFIGPRPALFNQSDLINFRNKYNVQLLKPGITGWAQVNGRDNLSIEDKVKLEHYYFKNKSIIIDFKIIILTIFKVLKAKDIKH